MVRIYRHYILSLEWKEISQNGPENLSFNKKERTCPQERIENFISNLLIRFTATR